MQTLTYKIIFNLTLERNAKKEKEIFKAKS